MNGDGSELELNCWSIFIHIRVTLHFLTCHNINPHERQARVATIYAHDLELYMCVIFFGTYGEVKLCLCTYSDHTHTHTKLHDVTIPSITLHYLTLISLRYVLHFLGVCLCLLYLALWCLLYAGLGHRGLFGSFGISCPCVVRHAKTDIEMIDDDRTPSDPPRERHGQSTQLTAWSVLRALP